MMLRRRRDGQSDWARRRKKFRKDLDNINLEDAVPVEKLWNFDQLTEDKERVPASDCSLTTGERLLKEYLLKVKKPSKFLLFLIKDDGSKQDKMSARAVLVQKFPLSSIRHVEGMIRVIESRSRRDSTNALPVLVEMFSGTAGSKDEKPKVGLLPDDRRLIAFRKRSIPTHGLKKRTLILYYFEDKVKSLYKRLIQALEQGSQDRYLFFKQKCTEYLATLLSRKPEEEGIILQCIVNKLTDPEFEMAGVAARLLSKVVEEHPVMASVIVKEVQNLLWRENLPKSAKFYIIVFCYRLDIRESPDVAGAVTKILLDAFKDHVMQKEVFSPKELRVLLQAVIKLFQTSSDITEVQKVYSEHSKAMFKFVEDENLRTAVTTMRFIYSAETSMGELRNGYYRILYRLLLRVQVAGYRTSMPSTMLLLNLVFEVLKNDKHVGRRLAFGRRLLQIALHGPTEFALSASLVLLNVDGCKGIMDMQSLGSTKSEWVYTANPINHEPLKCFKSETQEDPDPQELEDVTDFSEFPCRWELQLLRLNHWHKGVRKVEEIVDPERFRLEPFLDKWISSNPRKLSKKDEPTLKTEPKFVDAKEDFEEVPKFEQFYLKDTLEEEEELTGEEEDSGQEQKPDFLEQLITEMEAKGD